MLSSETARTVSVATWWDHFRQDTRDALRLLSRAPGFSAVVVLTLALGMGLNTAVFSVVNAVLVRPLSYPHAERVTWIAPSNPRGQDDAVISPDFIAWRDQSTSFESLVGFFTSSEPLDIGREVVQARIAAVTDGFWNLTGARFAHGGPPPSGQDGVVLPHGVFERWFRADASVVGQPVMLNGRQTVVTGVLAAGFRPQLVSAPAFLATAAGEIEIYRANVLQPTTANVVQIFSVLGRLKPGVSFDRARAELERIRAARPLPGPPRLRPGQSSRLRVVPFAEKLVGDARRPLIILHAAVALVLLIVCVNTATLLLVRGSARQREVAIKMAIGAGRVRILRQFFVESLLLGAMGGIGGLLIAQALVATMQRALPLAVPRLSEATIDARVLAYAFTVCVTTTIVFALIPALSMWRTNVNDTLQQGTRSASASGRHVLVRNVLVAAEVALTVVLLVAAGLMAKSFWQVIQYPPGFTPDRVLTMRVQFSGPRYRDPQNRRTFIDELLQRASTAPAVEAVGVGSNGGSMMLLTIEGEPDVPPDQKLPVVLSSASQGYASALGLRVVNGRWLTDREPTPVLVVNETLARQAFRGADPIGKRLRLPYAKEPAVFAPVVGVVADLRYSKLGAPPQPELFIGYEHASIFGTTLTLRTSADPKSIAPSLRTLLSSVDRTQPLFDVKPLDEVLADSIAPRRLNLLLLGTFAISALLLVIVGIFAVVAYAVVQRTHEIGVRIALGATPRQVAATVVRQGMAIAAGGIALGLAAALSSSRVMSALLYEVTPTDPATFAAAVATVAATAFAACCGPAIKAALIDPLVALRRD